MVIRNRQLGAKMAATFVQMTRGFDKGFLADEINESFQAVSIDLSVFKSNEKHVFY